MVGVWSRIVLEGYCLFEHLSKKEHKVYDMEAFKKKIAGDDAIKPEVRMNDKYVSADKKPAWCKLTNEKLVPQFKCLCNEDDNDSTCPFFGYCETDDDLPDDDLDLGVGTGDEKED
ncbi:hypothetical protein ACFL96_13400 [Thermoproteota archaeon]